MKRIFEAPKMDVETFPVEDVITASSGEVTHYQDEDETGMALNAD